MIKLFFKSEANLAPVVSAAAKEFEVGLAASMNTLREAYVASKAAQIGVSMTVVEAKEKEKDLARKISGVLSIEEITELHALEQDEEAKEKLDEIKAQKESAIEEAAKL